MTIFEETAPRLMRDLMAEPKFRFALDDAAAVAGNAAYECGGFEKLQEITPIVKGSRGGWGYFQWTGPRRVAFEAWCKRKRLSPSSYEANYSFLLRELLGPEKRAVAAVKNADGLEAKVKAFEAAYERAGVKAYARRLAWARKALDAHAKAAASPQPAPVSKPTSASAAVQKSATIPRPVQPPGPAPWATRLLIALGLLKAPAAQAVVPPGEGYSEVVERVQKRLQALGYPEVGLADGRFGRKTRDAIMAFAGDQSPPLRSTGELDDALHAALAKAQPRPVASNRAQTTARDLREAGNQPMQELSGIGWLGQLLGVGSVVGGLEQSGMFDSIKGAAETTTSTLASIQGVALSILGMVKWIGEHLWLIGLVLALIIIWKAAKGALQMLVLFRQGVLQRAAVGPLPVEGA